MPSHRPLIALCLLAITAAAGADVLPRFEITPYAGYRGGGHYLDAVGEADLDADVTYGVVANLRARHNTQWEILYGHSSTAIDDSAASADGSKLALDMDYLQLGGTYVFGDDRLVPFIALTIGATRLSPAPAQVESETYFSAGFGAGLRYDLTRRLGLRVEARAFGLFGKSNSLVFCERVGGVESCPLGGDGGVIPQFEVSAGLSFRY